jgi:hypothetical protein
VVSSARSLFTWRRKRFREELADLETGLQANRICTGEQKVQREDLMYEKLGHMKSFPIIPTTHSSYIGPTGDWDLKT